MPKLLRSELKSIVKECLVEILSEGIGSSSHSEPHQVNNNRHKTKATAKRKSYLDSIKHEVKEKKRLDPSKTNLTNDPVLNELLADTASTTLQEQLAADSKRRMSDMTRPADAAAPPQRSAAA